ncbi:S1 family peptidase [Enterovibrio calviensis]|uniref:S1 family peptidase n=1 Tax=Enterovibrio calviensis TaxID=91359 RepID=UPI0004841E4A|nr:serine protease [Enterovibrio calviensis]
MRSWQRNATLALLMLGGSAGVAAEDIKQPLIVGGSYAPISEAPWQVFLVIDDGVSPNQNVCGGLIIADEYVLTAAHCVSGHSSSDITVYAGIDDLDDARDASNGITLSNLVVNPNYDSSNFTADIALLTLSKSLPSNAKPIDLLGTSGQIDLDAEFSAGKSNNLYVSGWGATTTGGSVSNYLRRTLLTGVTDQQCSWNYTNNVFSQFLADATICANQTVTTGVCSGDSGGALIWQDPSFASDADFGYRAVGIVSFSSRELGCANTQSEDGFTQISNYFDWISDNIDGGYVQPSDSLSSNIFTATSGFTPPALLVPSSSDGGGGGSIGWLSLVFAGMIAARRRFSYS